MSVFMSIRLRESICTEMCRNEQKHTKLFPVETILNQEENEDNFIMFQNKRITHIHNQRFMYQQYGADYKITTNYWRKSAGSFVE